MSSLKQYISEGEHQTQDFKFRIDDQRKIARTLAAFANTDGGRLLIGVKDNGKITGINPEEEFHMIEGAASFFCKPAVELETKVWKEDLRLVLEVRIKASEARNHTAPDETGKWRIYVRRQDHTLLANKILLKVWTFQKKGLQRPQAFGPEEIQFLKIIEQQVSVTLSKLYQLQSALPKPKIDHMLALLVHWNVVRMDMSEEGTFYALR
jgi:hypothetical protein